MVEFGDISLKTTQLKLIEKCSDIDYYDLLSKYEILSNKFYKTSKKNDFIDDFSQKENKENKNTIQKRIILKKKNEYTKINNINYDNIKKILSGIIFFCYMEPKNIDKVQKKIFFSLINSDLEEYYFILKLISIVHARHEEINIENLLKISKQDKNINYKIIEKLLINIINDEYFNKYYKNFNLEKNINDFIIKNYDIELNKKCIELIKLEEKNEKVNNNYQDKIAIMNDIEQIKNQKFILQNKILNND
jgi:hypothetical protein